MNAAQSTLMAGIAATPPPDPEQLVERAAKAIWEHDWQHREPRRGLPAPDWESLPPATRQAIGKTARAALVGAGVLEAEDE